MDGIILTEPVGAFGGSGGTGAITDTVLPASTEIVDTCLCAPCPAIKWLITARNLTNDETATMEVNAIHDFSGNVDFNCHSILGSSLPIEVTAIAGGGADEIDLSIENTSVGDTIDVCVFRIVQ